MQGYNAIKDRVKKAESNKKVNEQDQQRHADLASAVGAQLLEEDEDCDVGIGRGPPKKSAKRAGAALAISSKASRAVEAPSRTRAASTSAASAAKSSARSDATPRADRGSASSAGIVRESRGNNKAQASSSASRAAPAKDRTVPVTSGMLTLHNVYPTLDVQKILESGEDVKLGRSRSGAQILATSWLACSADD
jgi:hypothetical protein